MYQPAFEPSKENRALRKKEKLTSACSVQQRKAFTFFFCQSHLPFVMDKEKVPCGAPPQSTAASLYTC